MYCSNRTLPLPAGNGTSNEINTPPYEVGIVRRNAELGVTKIAGDVSAVRKGVLRIFVEESPDIEILYPILPIKVMKCRTLTQSDTD